jgi:hypothetical protein
MHDRERDGDACVMAFRFTLLDNLSGDCLEYHHTMRYKVFPGQ